MPLKPGSSSKIISTNISEFHGGKTYTHTKNKFGKKRADAQAVAVAMSNARKGYAAGGTPPAPWYERMAMRGMGRSISKGIGIHSDIPGRTDKIATSVPAGTYILPADIVSGMGQGNTAAGMKKINSMLQSGSIGLKKPKGFAGFGNFRKPAGPGSKRIDFKAAGGATTPDVPVVLAGGEYRIHPHAVHEIGGGDMKKGHDYLDGWVLEKRKALINTLKNLKPPRKD